MSAPVEAKVKAASGIGTVVAFVAALVSHYLWGDGPLPEPVVALIGAAVTGVGTFVAGWLARHTPRFATPTETTTGGEAPPLGPAVR